MSVDTPPPNIVDPIGRAVWNVLCGSGGPVSKLNEQVDKIRNETKSVGELKDVVGELNSTLQDTNSILRDFLDKI